MQKIQYDTTENRNYVFICGKDCACVSACAPYRNLFVVASVLYYWVQSYPKEEEVGEEGVGGEEENKKSLSSNRYFVPE